MLLNGAVIAPNLKEIHIKLILIIHLVSVITITGYIFSFLLAKWLKYDRPILVSFTFIGGMRNITVIAITYFPPEVIVPVVTGMIFQQAIASLYASFLDRHYHQKAADKSNVST